MTRRIRLLFIIPVGILAITLFAFIGGQIVKLLWNWLLPTLFGVRAVTFWQALGLLALCRILFGGSGLLSHSGSRARRRMADRWDAMTPEERERVRQRMREKWGLGGNPSHS